MARVKQTVNTSGYHCMECVHCYDHHEKNVKGDFFMGRCPHRQWAVFLNSDHCDKFQLKK